MHMRWRRILFSANTHQDPCCFEMLSLDEDFCLHLSNTKHLKVLNILYVVLCEILSNLGDKVKSLLFLLTFFPDLFPSNFLSSLKTKTDPLFFFSVWPRPGSWSTFQESYVWRKRESFPPTSNQLPAGTQPWWDIVWLALVKVSYMLWVHIRYCPTVSRKMKNWMKSSTTSGS